MKKIIIALVAVLLVILGGYAFSKDYFINGEADLLKAFSGWKSYSGKSGVFSFKYPAEWTVDDYSQPDVISMTSATSPSTFSTYREKAPNKKQTVSEWLKARDQEMRDLLQSDVQRIVSKKSIKVGKLPAIRRKEYAPAAGMDFLQTYVKNGDAVYMFTLGVPPNWSYSAAEEKMYDKILSTVKFIK